MLGLRFCAMAFSSCGKRGPLFIAVHGPLTVAASLVAEHRLQTRRLSSCGSRAQLLRGMWDPPRPGREPVSPALAGRLSTTAPPGKPPRPLLLALLKKVSDSQPTEILIKSSRLPRQWRHEAPDTQRVRPSHHPVIFTHHQHGYCRAVFFTPRRIRFREPAKYHSTQLSRKLFSNFKREEEVKT